MTHHKFICGDVLDALAALPDQSVHCIVTSPPYWGLRDYGVSGQLGLEPTPEEYVDRLVTIFREARRVLREDGTLWLNLGDTMLQKQLLGIPWRVAFGLQDDGWWLRAENIWHKPNAMRESVTDRPTRVHEQVFLLSKNAQYFYDAEAIRETAQQPMRIRNDRFGGCKHTGETTQHSNGSIYVGSATRNKESVWTVSTRPFPGAHFATFPPDLIEPMILAGTSKRGCCPTCGNPYVRETMRTGHESKRESAYVPHNNPTKTDSSGWAPATMATDNWIAGCECNAGDSIPCTVLDPFGGSGTVSMVAQNLGRDSVYIDINPDYREMAIRRCGFRENRLFELATYEVLEVAS